MAGSAGDGEFGFQIAPMLDVLFVLLLFFMVTAGAQKHEASLTTELPGSGGPSGDVPLQIGIDSDGQVTFSGVPVGDPDDHELQPLIDRLTQVLAANATQPVVISPVRSARHQRVIDVLNACAAAKVKNLAFGSPAD